MLHERITKTVKVGLVKQGTDTLIAREAVQKYWDIKDFHRKDPKRRLFEVIKQENSDTIVGNDFKPMFTHLLAHHPGLEFLK